MSKAVVRFRVQGLDCADEVAIVRGAVRPVVGEENLRFDILRGRMDVLVPADPAVVIAAVAGAGMRATQWTDVAAPDAAANHCGSVAVRLVLLAM